MIYTKIRAGQKGQLLHKITFLDPSATGLKFIGAASFELWHYSFKLLSYKYLCEEAKSYSPPVIPKKTTLDSDSSKTERTRENGKVAQRQNNFSIPKQPFEINLSRVLTHFWQ